MDLNQFRAKGDGQLQVSEPKRPPRHKAGEWFVKGPIPGEWIGRAATLPGKTLHVALALWYVAGLGKRRRVKLTGKVLERFGVGRDAGYGGLKRLEAAGLVEVERHSGRCPWVTICEWRRPRYQQLR